MISSLGLLNRGSSLTHGNPRPLFSYFSNLSSFASSVLCSIAGRQTAMPSGVSSKHIKNHSDEERSKKKKMKSSGKRRRRARDSSPSDSVASRGRRKSSRREPKSSRRSPSRGDDRKRRRDSKKPAKKKSRKPRSRRDASVSSTSSRGSSRSCSTCHGRNGSTDRSISGRSRSLSPIRSDRKVRLKARGRSRGRNRGRKSRYRSPSCSTCSGYNSGSSPSRRRHKKKSKERDTARTKSHKGSDKIIRDDDFRPSRSNDGYNVGRKCEKEQAMVDEVVRKGAWNARGQDGSYKMMGEDIVSSEANTTSAKNADGSGDDSRQCRMGLMKERSARMNSEVVANTLPAANTYDGRNDSLGHQSRKNPEVVASSNNLEAEDLELILRQKALENLRKFRGGLSASSRSLGDQKDETVSTESSKDGGCEISKGSIKSIVCNPASTLENHRPTHVEAPPFEGRIEFCANPLAGDPNDNVSFTLSDGHKIPSSKDGQDAQHQVKKVHESFTKTSSKQSSLSKDIQKKRGVAESGSSKGCEAEVNIAEGSSCLDMEIGNCKSDQTMAEATSRSQFEQKTFSRMKDGEVVQVSYKVYIPNKRPTLARRELQR